MLLLFFTVSPFRDVPVAAAVSSPFPPDVPVRAAFLSPSIPAADVINIIISILVAVVAAACTLPLFTAIASAAVASPILQFPV